MNEISVNPSAWLFKLSLFLCYFALIMVGYFAEEFLVLVFFSRHAFVWTHEFYIFLRYAALFVYISCINCCLFLLFELFDLENTKSGLIFNLDALYGFNLDRYWTKLTGLYELLQVNFASDCLLFFENIFYLLCWDISVYKYLIKKYLVVV